ncbi:MAG: RNA polymerase sigma factor [Ruminococcus sp.]|jgi:RNA polymerase sigma factor (sigma-70 family)
MERKRDKDTFLSLYETVYQDLYRFAFYTLKNRQDAEDVVQDTAADAYSGFGKLRELESFRRWIFKILSNKCRRKLKEYVTHPLELLQELSTEENLTERIQVRNAFWRLSDEERLIISMHVFAGYTGKEIARILHKKEGTVRSRESRALKKMGQMLEE